MIPLENKVPAPCYKPHIRKVLCKEIYKEVLLSELDFCLWRQKTVFSGLPAVSWYRMLSQLQWDHGGGRWISAALFSPLTDSIQWNLRLWCVIYWFLSLGCLGWFYPLRISENKNIPLPAQSVFLKERSLFTQMKVYTCMSELISHMAKIEAGCFLWLDRQLLYWLGS